MIHANRHWKAAARVLADAGHFSAANVVTCEAADITPLFAIQRDAHHLPLMERFADDPAPPESTDPIVKMTHTKRRRGEHCTGGARARSNRCSASSSM